MASSRRRSFTTHASRPYTPTAASVPVNTANAMSTYIRSLGAAARLMKRSSMVLTLLSGSVGSSARTEVRIAVVTAATSAPRATSVIGRYGNCRSV